MSLVRHMRGWSLKWALLEAPMPVILAPLAAENAAPLQGLVQPSVIAQIVAHADILRYRAVFDGNVCVGVVGLKLLPESLPEVIVATVPAQRQKVYATAAVSAILRYAFEETNVAAVYAKCEATRNRSPHSTRGGPPRLECSS